MVTTSTGHGRSDAEIEQDRANAIEFFQQRFGIDVVDNENVMFTSFTFDPRNEYRAYVVAGRDVPPEGWVVRDGGWSVAVTNPDGLTLGGEYEGVQVPQGSMMVFGDYNIDVPGEDPIIIHYQSGGPIIPTDQGIQFHCELISDRLRARVSSRYLGWQRAGRWIIPRQCAQRPHLPRLANAIARTRSFSKFLIPEKKPGSSIS